MTVFEASKKKNTQHTQLQINKTGRMARGKQRKTVTVQQTPRRYRTEAQPRRGRERGGGGEGRRDGAGFVVIKKTKNKRGYSPLDAT